MPFLGVPVTDIPSENFLEPTFAEEASEELAQEVYCALSDSPDTKGISATEIASHMPGTEVASIYQLLVRWCKESLIEVCSGHGRELRYRLRGKFGDTSSDNSAR